MGGASLEMILRFIVTGKAPVFCFKDEPENLRLAEMRKHFSSPASIEEVYADQSFSLLSAQLLRNSFSTFLESSVNFHGKNKIIVSVQGEI